MQLKAGEHDSFESLVDGNCRRAYEASCERASKHASGWAMRNTNNHNPAVLKKSCLGVLVCSARHAACPSRPALHLKPAICHKARAKQIGQISLRVSRIHVISVPRPRTRSGGVRSILRWLSSNSLQSHRTRQPQGRSFCACCPCIIMSVARSSSVGFAIHY